MICANLLIQTETHFKSPHSPQLASLVLLSFAALCPDYTQLTPGRPSRLKKKTASWALLSPMCVM